MVLLTYQKLSLLEERHLIARAKRGSRKSANEVVSRHMGFVVFRLHKRGFPEFVRRYGEDVVSEAIPLLYRQIKTYDLNYRNPQGNLKPVRFVSYIWKRVDGLIIDSLKKEMRKEWREIALN